MGEGSYNSSGTASGSESPAWGSSSASSLLGPQVGVERAGSMSSSFLRALVGKQQSGKSSGRWAPGRASQGLPDMYVWVAAQPRPWTVAVKSSFVSPPPVPTLLMPSSLHPQHPSRPVALLSGLLVTRWTATTLCSGWAT